MEIRRREAEIARLNEVLDGYVEAQR